MTEQTASRRRGKQAVRQVSREDAAGKPTRSAGQNFLLAGEAGLLAVRHVADGLPAEGLLADGSRLALLVLLAGGAGLLADGLLAARLACRRSRLALLSCLPAGLLADTVGRLFDEGTFRLSQRWSQSAMQADPRP
jgi:hypothetical protein